MNWMTFVDGENLTIQAEAVCEEHSIELREGSRYRPKTFVWFPERDPRLFRMGVEPPVHKVALRCHYYTSVVGAEETVKQVREHLRSMNFEPVVFKKPSQGKKTKGVDITLTRDMLDHAHRDNFDACFLFAGDGDYVPLVESVKRLGKIVHVAFFETKGLNPELRLHADTFHDIGRSFVDEWQRFLKRV